MVQWARALNTTKQGPSPKEILEREKSLWEEKRSHDSPPTEAGPEEGAERGLLSVYCERRDSRNDHI